MMNTGIKKQLANIDQMIIDLKLDYLDGLIRALQPMQEEMPEEVYDITIHLPQDHDAVIVEPTQNGIQMIEPSENEVHNVMVGSTHIEPMDNEMVSIDRCSCEDPMHHTLEKQEVLTSQTIHTPIAAKASTKQQDKLKSSFGSGMKERDDNEDIQELHSAEGIIAAAMGKSDGDIVIPQHYYGTGVRVLKSLPDENDYIVYGCASTNLLDKQGHVISIDALRKAVPKFMEQENFRNIMLFHSDIQIGEVIPEYVTPDGKIYKTEVDDRGWWVVGRIRKDIEASRNTIKAIENGELNGFSIAGNALMFHNKCDSQGCYISIDDLELYELSACFIPVNNDAKFTVIHHGGVEGTCPHCSII